MMRRMMSIRQSPSGPSLRKGRQGWGMVGWERGVRWGEDRWEEEEGFGWRWQNQRRMKWERMKRGGEEREKEREKEKEKEGMGKEVRRQGFRKCARQRYRGRRRRRRRE